MTRRMTMIHRICLDQDDKLSLKGYHDSLGSSSSSFSTLDVVTVTILPSIGEHEQVLHASLDNISETTTDRENKIESIKLRVQQRKQQRQQSRMAFLSQQLQVGRRTATTTTATPSLKRGGTTDGSPPY